MIDVFFHRPATKEFFHARVIVTIAPDSERAQALVHLLNEAGYLAGGRPSDDRQGTVAQLVAKRDAALDREISLTTKRSKPKMVASRD